MKQKKPVRSPLKPRADRRRGSSRNAETTVAPAASRPLRIGAVARQLGISPSMIRSWERLGLRRESIEEGQHRLYEERDIELLCRAVYLRRVQGLNAPGIIDQVRREGLLPGDGEQRVLAHAQAAGGHLRALRLARGESLAQVAAAVGISTGFLSNLERSQTGVSVGIMHRLAHHYGTTLSEFYFRADSPGPLVPKNKRRLLSSDDGVRMEELAWGNIVMEPHIFHVAPGKGSLEYYTHQGQEFLYLIEGRLAITLDDKEYLLDSGDSFYFESSIRHRWKNAGKSIAVVLWVNTAERLAIVR
jgi:DNA-binding transcriptional MerR regulator